MELQAQLLALIALLVGAVVYLAKRPVKPAAGSAAQITSLHDCAEEFKRIDAEIEKLRDWRHNTASLLGSVGMLPALMRNLASLRERVVRLEARLGVIHHEGDSDA